MHKINGELTKDKGNMTACPLCYEELFTNYDLRDVIVIQCFEKNLVELMLDPEDPEVAEQRVITCKPITREQEEELVKGCKEGFYELFDMDGNKFTKLDFGSQHVNKKAKKLIKIRNKLNKTSIYLTAYDVDSKTGKELSTNGQNLLLPGQTAVQEITWKPDQRKRKGLDAKVGFRVVPYYETVQEANR